MLQSISKQNQISSKEKKGKIKRTNFRKQSYKKVFTTEEIKKQNQFQKEQIRRRYIKRSANIDNEYQYSEDLPEFEIFVSMRHERFLINKDGVRFLTDDDSDILFDIC